MKEIKYRCEFIFNHQHLFCRSEGGIREFDAGFWINNKLRFTKGGDAKYWIPPSAIKYIEKES